MRKFTLWCAVAVAAIMCGNIPVNAAVDITTLIKNGDGAVAKVASMLNGVGGFKLGKNSSGLQDAAIAGSLQGYSNYIVDALSMIEAMKGQGLPIADAASSLETSNTKNAGILEKLMNKGNLSPAVRAAIKSAVATVKQVQEKLQILKK